jgi:hypothetical protein
MIQIVIQNSRDSFDIGAMETNFEVVVELSSTRRRSCLRHYAKSRKIAISRPDEVDFFNLPNPSGRSMALGLTQSLTEMSTRNLPDGYRAAGA